MALLRLYSAHLWRRGGLNCADTEEIGALLCPRIRST
jgi:hypothetical protein